MDSKRMSYSGEQAKRQLAEGLRKFVAFTDAECEQMSARTKLRFYKKGELLLKEGAVCNVGYFILAGCVRYFFTVDGKENTGQFFFENTWYTDLESFLSMEPSEQSIQALEDTWVLQISRSDLHALYQNSHNFERFGRLLVEHGFVGLRKKNKILANLSPEERYIDLQKTRPKVLERVPQFYIASYLGIQPESLSRIRKRMVQQTGN